MGSKTTTHEPFLMKHLEEVPRQNEGINQEEDTGSRGEKKSSIQRLLDGGEGRVQESSCLGETRPDLIKLIKANMWMWWEIPASGKVEVELVSFCEEQGRDCPGSPQRRRPTQTHTRGWVTAAGTLAVVAWQALGWRIRRLPKNAVLKCPVE